MQKGSRRKECATGEDVCYCPVKGVIDTVGKKYALALIGLIGNHKGIRFNEIMEHFEDISPKTLTERLKEMKSRGLVTRKSFAEIPPRVEYSLTEKGVQLRGAIKPLMEWASKNS